MSYRNPMNMDMEEFNQIMKDTNIFELLDLDFLIRIYPDLRLSDGFATLKQDYPFFRAVKGDGNCFYRAVAFSYLRESDLSRFSNIFKPVRNICANTPIICSGDQLHNRLQIIHGRYLAPIDRLYGSQRQNALQELFVQNEVLDTLMIMYLRSLTYHEILENRQYYKSWVTNPEQVDHIRTFGKESEGIEFQAMARALNIIIVTQAVTNLGFTYVKYNQKARSSIEVDIFFRPGHYDITYPRNSIYLENVNKYTKFQSPTQTYHISGKNRDPYDQLSSRYERHNPQNYENFEQKHFERSNNYRLDRQGNSNFRKNNNKSSYSSNPFESTSNGFHDLREQIHKQSSSTEKPEPRPSSPAKRTNSNQRQVIQPYQAKSQNILSEPWNTPNTFQIDKKNKIQEAAFLLLALVAIGYIMSLF